MKRSVKLRILFASVFVLFFQSNLVAQRVTVSPTSGKVITSKSFYTKDNYYVEEEAQTDGFGAMWIHNQLPLTMISAASGDNELLSDGLLKTHGNKISSSIAASKGLTLIGGGVTTSGKVIDKSEKMDLNYLVLSLPKGYRFTAYKITLKADIATTDIPEHTNEFNTNVNITFQETLSGTKNGVFVADAATVGNAVSIGYMGKGNIAHLERTSEIDGDMGNTLYFQYGQNTSWGFVAFSIASFEVSFEASTPFTESFAPIASTIRGFDCVKAEFNTGRVDIGPLNHQTKTVNNVKKEFYGYNYLYVAELLGAITLYNDDGLKTDGGKKYPDPTVFSPRNISGELLKDNTYAYILKPDVYYIETPTVIYGSGLDSTEGVTNVPVGYRITGAKLHFKHLAIEPAAETFKIKYYSTGAKRWLYLNLDTSPSAKNGLTYSMSAKSYWQMEHAGDDYYICTKTSDGTTYYLCARALDKASSLFEAYTSTTKTTPMRKRADGTISLGGQFTAHYLQKVRGNTYINSVGDTVKVDGAYSYMFLKDKTYAAQVEDVTTSSGTTTETKPSNYVVKIYDTKTGTSVDKTITVTNESQTIELTDLNNDAIKFEICAPDGSTATDVVGAMTFDLKMEALDPYVQKVDIKGESIGGEYSHTLSQQFVTTDFRIGADDMPFFVPTALQEGNTSINFSFTNLYNNHHDNTYFEKKGTGYGRYNFVNSTYYNSINEDLHTNAATAAADGKYEEKTTVDTYGTKPFTFNNAETLLSTESTNDTRYFQEYLFAKADYIGTDTEGNVFKKLNIGVNDATTHNFYLFVVDETRYNISPATGLRHQYYAFYHGSLKLEIADYTPNFKFQKLYETTLSQGQTTEDTDAYYGVKVSVLENETMTTEDLKKGYLTIAQIQGGLKTYLNTEDRPKDYKHILYVDASGLKNVLHDDSGVSPRTTKSTSEVGSMADFRSSLADNALIYLPNLTTCYVDNTARLMLGGKFTACQDIVITDQQPFHTAYDISLDNYKTVVYERLGQSTHNTTTYATLLLPFSISVDNEGRHINADDEIHFYKPVETGFLKDVKPKERLGHDYYGGTANFTRHKTLNHTEANVPYLIEVKSSSDKDKIFVIRQTGAYIYATGLNDSELSKGSRLEGLTATATINGVDTKFKLVGSYAGDARPYTDNLFYFANGEFYSSKNLGSGNVLTRSFRAYMEYPESSGAAKIASLSLNFDENGSATDIIIPMGEDGDNALLVSGGDGFITVKANVDTEVSICSVAGQTVSRCNLSTGETTTIPVARGIYLVNGKKIVVK